MLNLTKRQEYQILMAEMEATRRPIEPHWRDVADYLLPYRLRLELSEANRSERKNHLIIDETSTLGLRTLPNGMMAGIHSPAQPWVRLTTEDPELAEFGPAKEWYDYVTRDMLSIFDGSTLYQSLPTCYKDMAGFAIGAMSIEENFDDVIYTQTYKPGSYLIARDDFGMVNVLTRKYRMTVRQIVKRWPKGHYSVYLKNLIELKRWETYVDICHVTAPNEDYDATKAETMSDRKMFRSCYYELGSADGASGYLKGKEGEELFLSERGFDEFPFVCGRWERDEEGPWGSDCPGMVAIGGTRELQFGERRIAKAIDKVVDPPVQGPTSLRDKGHPGVPGKVTWTPPGSPPDAFRPVYQINPDIAAADARQERLARRLNRIFYVDLFQMLTLMAEREMTATEIAERKQEKLVEIAPTLTNVNHDILNPVVMRTFSIMLRQGRVPPPPREIQGRPIAIKYEGIMAQALRAIGLSAIDRVAGFVGELAKVNPAVLDKFDSDQAVDEYAIRAGAPPRIIVPDDRVSEIRAARAEAQAAANRAQMLETISKGVKTLSETNTEGKNALTDMAAAAGGRGAA